MLDLLGSFVHWVTGFFPYWVAVAWVIFAGGIVMAVVVSIIRGVTYVRDKIRAWRRPTPKQEANGQFTLF